MPPTLLSLETPVVIAHRGGARLRPENTLLAFDHAVSLGVDGLECDVHLSSDGQLVVIHDATLDRTTNARGPVSARTAEELAHVDAAFHFLDASGRPVFRGTGVGVPRLSEVFCRYPDLPLVVELKGEDPAIAGALLALVERHGRARSVIVGGFSHEVLMAMRRLAPELPTSASPREVRSAIHRSWLWLAPATSDCRLFQVPLRYHGRRVLTRRLAKGLRRAQVPVHVWVVDDVDEMAMILDWGVTGLITDRPDQAREVLAARA